MTTKQKYAAAYRLFRMAKRTKNEANIGMIHTALLKMHGAKPIIVWAAQESLKAR